MCTYLLLSGGGHINHAKDIQMQEFHVHVVAEDCAPYSGSW